MSAKAVTWSRLFDDPIILPDGRVLRTRHDAGHYARALSKAVQERVDDPAPAGTPDACGS